MTAKQYLQTYRQYERYYNAIIEQLKMIDSEMINLKSPSLGDRVQKSPINDPIGETVIKLEREKGKLGMRLTEYRAKMLLIQRQISEMDEINADYYVVLLFRYVADKDWRFICDKLHLSRSQANVIHGKALLEFDSKFGKIYANK